MKLRIVFTVLLSSLVRGQYEGGLMSRPLNIPEITNLDVMCGKDQMTVQVGFASDFDGLIFSKGQFNSPGCVYVQPSSGRSGYTFDISYNKCGTKPDLNGKFYENTIIIQYDSQLIEVWDEAKRLRCEWYNDYEKTATKAPVVIADLEVIELNFRGDNVDCWMEIQDGKGPWASPVTGIVPLGSTLTMVIAINDPNGEFDMRTKECEASDGQGRPIQLSDQDGCVLRPKMISSFKKLRNNDGRSTALTYAHFHAFKFPDSMYVHLRCKVEICRYGCPDHCQQAVAGGYPASRRVDAALPVASDLEEGQSNSIEKLLPQTRSSLPSRDYLKRVGEQANDISEEVAKAPGAQNRVGITQDDEQDSSEENVLLQRRRQAPPPTSPKRRLSLYQRIQPHQSASPLFSNVGSKDSSQTSAFKAPEHGDGDAVPLSRNVAQTSDAGLDGPVVDRSEFPWGPRSLKIRRKRFAVNSPTAKAAAVGVGSTLEVISQNDLQFESSFEDKKRVSIFQGRISDEVVYGVCLPAAGFSALFVLVAMLTIVSVLVAGFLCRHRQEQKEDCRRPAVIPLRQWPIFIRQRLYSSH